jgi:signal transduction histidine kinase/CHASE1-domain containing sensor protein
MRPLLINRVKPFFTPLPALWIGALLSSAVGMLFFVGTSKLIESDSRERFAYHARNAQNTISARVKSYTDVLRGGASVFQASYPLSRGQFHKYVAGLSLERYFPAIETINYAQYVRAADLPDLERGWRTQHMDGTDGSGFGVKPPGKRKEYCIITYIAGRNILKEAFGLDILANPRVSKANLASRDSGVLIASGLPIAHMSGPNRTGLGMRLPVYRPGMPLDTVMERRAAYIGSVGIAFSVDMLVQGVLDEMAIKHVRLTLVDSGLKSDNPLMQGSAVDQVLFDSSGTDKQPRPPLLTPAEAFSNTLPVDFNGRVWKATFSTPKRNMYTGFDEYFPWMAMGAGFVSSMLIYALLHTLTSSRRRAIQMAEEMTVEVRDSQARLQQTHENLRRLAAHADHIKEGERKRIAREIHDDLGQNLLAVRIEADMLTSRTSGRHPRLHARALSTLSQIDATIRSVRQIINDLRPNVLDLGLSAAVEWQTSEFVRRTGISCDVENRSEISLNDHRATAFFRILQESLSNIVRHAKASKVKVELQLDAGGLAMAVSDNGVGVLPGNRNKAGSFGLVGIEERIKILGGVFSIASTPGTGTTVRVWVPLRDDVAQPDLMLQPETRESHIASI